MNNYKSNIINDYKILVNLLKNDELLKNKIINISNIGGEISFYYNIDYNKFGIIDISNNKMVKGIKFDPDEFNILTFHSHPDDVSINKYPVPSKIDICSLLRSSYKFNKPISDCIVNKDFNYTIYCSNNNFLLNEKYINNLDSITDPIEKLNYDYINKHNSIEKYIIEFYDSNLNEFIDIIPSCNIK